MKKINLIKMFYSILVVVIESGIICFAVQECLANNSNPAFGVVLWFSLNLSTVLLVLLCWAMYEGIVKKWWKWVTT